MDIFERIAGQAMPQILWSSLLVLSICALFRRAGRAVTGLARASSAVNAWANAEKMKEVAVESTQGLVQKDLLLD